MSTFKNVTDVDLEVSVDGRRIDAPAEGTFKVADEFDYTLVANPAFEIVKASKSSAVAESTPEPSSATEGEK